MSKTKNIGMGMNSKNAAEEKRSHFCIILAIIAALAAAFFFVMAIIFSDGSYPFGFIKTGGKFAYEFIHVGESKFSIYYLMHIVGFVGGAIVLLKRRKRYETKVWLALVTDVLLLIFGYAGAKILFILEDPSTALEYGFTIGGVSFFGTVFFLPPLVLLAALIFRKKPFVFLDYCVPAIIQMLIFIRIGCFTAGCCGGITVIINSNPVTIPTQLIEVALDLLMLDVILRIDRSGKYEGVQYAWFMLLYGVLRFVVEFMRDTAKATMGLSHGQWFAIISVIIGGGVLLFYKIKTQKGRKEEV